MNKQKQKEKIFDLLFESCKDYLRLYNWQISFNFKREDENYSASLEDCDFSHLMATITYNKEMWQKINKEDID